MSPSDDATDDFPVVKLQIGGSIRMTLKGVPISPNMTAQKPLPRPGIKGVEMCGIIIPRYKNPDKMAFRVDFRARLTINAPPSGR